MVNAGVLAYWVVARWLDAYWGGRWVLRGAVGRRRCPFVAASFIEWCVDVVSIETKQHLGTFQMR